MEIVPITGRVICGGYAQIATVKHQRTDEVHHIQFNNIMSHNNEDPKKAVKNPSLMDNHNVLIGWLLIILGVVLGLYVGLYVMFIGGIVQIVTQIGAATVSAPIIAWGVVKIVFAAFVGWLIALACIFPGFAIANANTKKHHHTSRRRW